jgi:hypothetical protein
MFLGNTPIVSDTGGMKDYIHGMSGFRVNGNQEPVLGYDCAVPSLGTARESWFNIDQFDLMRLMRKVYNLHMNEDPILESMREVSKKVAEEYSYEVIGEQMKELLSE